MSEQHAGHSKSIQIVRRILDLLIFCGLALVLFFNSMAFGGVHDISIAISETMVFGLFCLWAVRRCLGRDSGGARNDPAWRRYALPVLAMLLLVLLALQFCPLPHSALKLLSPKTLELTRAALDNVSDGEEFGWSTISVTPLNSVQEWIQLLSYVLFFAMVGAVVSSRAAARRLAWVVVGIGTALAFITFTQMLTGAAEGVYGFWRSRHSREIYGVFVNRNTFAAHMGMLVPLAIGLAVSGGRARPRRHSSYGRRSLAQSLRSLRPSQVLLAGVTLLIASAVFCSVSRGALVAFFGTFFLSLLLAGILIRSRRAVWFVLGVGIILLISGALLRGEALWERFADIPSRAQGRLWFWRDTLKIVKDFPLMGGGLGSFPTLFRAYKNEPTTWGFVAHPHSDYLNLAAEAGLGGVALIGAMLLILAKRAIDLVRSSASPARYLNLACVIGAAPILIQSGFTVSFEMPANVFVFLSLMALAQTLPEGGMEDRDAGQAAGVAGGAAWWVSAAGAAAAAGMAIFLIGYVWREYDARALLRDEQILAGSRESLEESIRLLRKAVTVEPGLAPVHAGLGMLIERGAARSPEYSYAEACAHYVKAIAAEPLDPYYHSYLGELYARVGNEALGQKTDRSEAEFLKACRLAPMDDTFSFALGQYYLRREKLDTAVEHFRDSLRLRSFYLSDIFAQLWDKTKSVEVLRKAIPPRPDVLLSIAALLMSRKENEAALAELEQAMTLEDSLTVRQSSTITRSLIELGAWDKAETWLRECLENAPGSSALKLELVRVLLQQGKLAEALGVMEEMDKDYPGNPEYLVRMADIHCQLGHYEQAEQFYAAAVKLDPRHYPAMGAFYDQQKKFHKTVSLYQKWVERCPQKAMSHKYLGLSLERTGNYLGALAEFEKAAKLDPKGKHENDVQRAKEELESELIRFRKK